MTNFFCGLVFGRNHLANRPYFFFKLNEISWGKVHKPGKVHSKLQHKSSCLKESRKL